MKFVKGETNGKYADNNLNGYIDGLNQMKKMVLTVFTEHPEMNKEEIKKYIEENL